MGPRNNKKTSLFQALTLSLFCLCSQPTMAQQDSSADSDNIEEIIVTGSRIARDPNLTGALPVQTVPSEEIQLSGEFALADVVNDIPALLLSITSETSIDSTATSGANILNLRGLGANRTLTLVNGRRHVSGVQGSSALDVGSIPMRLVERVEVLTGGGSAIYGADAVTGVVNFILKDDYEGFGVGVSYGISAEGDGQQTVVTGTWGTNFANDRGNFVVSVDYRADEGLSMRDRPGSLFGSGGNWLNPALRFQIGDIAGSTPLFEQYFNYNNTGLINYGLPIPTAANFVADYNAAFPLTPITEGRLSSAELTLIDRAANAPQRAVLPERTFPFTSGYGYVAPGNAFTFAGFDPDTAVDLDMNGVPDCQDSFYGYNSVFGAASFGVIGGCWNIVRDGTYLPVRDGLVADDFQGFGGDSINVSLNDNQDFLLPDDKVSINVMGHYDISDTASLFGEFKYVTAETDTGFGSNSFWDLILGAPDNPFLPAFLQPIAAAAGGVSITVDPLHFDANRTIERDTIRGVVGVEGEFDNRWNYEISANFGRFELNRTRTNRVINDRWFAALDAIIDPATGQPACRSSVDPTAPPMNTPFEIPAYEAGYFSFTPGDGQCAPLDIWNGHDAASQAAKDFVLVDEWTNIVLDQFVLSAILTGDTEDWFELPAGPIAFVVGAEYRDESSEATRDPWQRGEIPAGAPFPAGSNIEDFSANDSLTFRPQIARKNEVGSYDVYDVFLETSFPLLIDQPGARELTLDLAARFSDYSTIGRTTTWKANLIYAPVNSLAFRGSFSEAVRAPNISELFGPAVGTSFRPIDPCDAAQLNAIAADNPTLAAQTQANCEAVFDSIGLDPTDGMGNYIFGDPLSASFGGITTGNPNLTEETAETFTVGFIFQPEFLPGLSLTADYWNISIDDAIEAVSSQNIVDGCYQGPSLNAEFCDLSARNSDPLSAQFGGFNFLRQTTLNFAIFETSGIDLTATYQFEVGAHGFDVTVQGTRVNELNQFQNPLDLTDVNPELGEIGRPELAGNIFLIWNYGDWQLGWQTQYIDSMLYGGIEVETALSLYGPTVFQDDFWRHDFNARYLMSDELMIYGGVKNVTDEQPFITQNAFPASPRGTFFFLGVDWQM